MKNTLSILLVMIPSAAAAVPSCPGKVTEILEWPGKCNNNLAFRLDSTSGSWLCTNSEKSSSMVLAAYAAGKTISPRLATDIACDAIEHYHTPLYIILRD